MSGTGGEREEMLAGVAAAATEALRAGQVYGMKVEELESAVARACAAGASVGDIVGHAGEDALMLLDDEWREQAEQSDQEDRELREEP